MKNHLNLKIIFAVLIMGLSACKKEDTQSPTPIPTDPKKGKLKEITWDNDLKAVFEYNDKGLLSKRIDNNGTFLQTIYDFTYNAQNRLINSKVSDQDGEYVNYVFEYEADLLKKVSRKDATQALLSYNTYAHNAQKQLIEVLGYTDIFGEQKLNGKFTFQYDAHGNLNELKTLNFNEPKNRFELHYTYQFENFDGKKRIEYFSFIDPFNPTLDLFQSNPLKIKAVNSAGVLDFTQVYTYTYDTTGKPTKKQIVITGQSNATIEGEFQFY